MGFVRRFRKYGEHFDTEDPDRPLPPAEPESPYETPAYVAPEKRAPSPLEQEKAYLAELRGGSDNHYDT